MSNIKIFTFILAFVFQFNLVAGKPADSLRTGAFIKGMNALVHQLEDSIIPQLSSEEKKNIKTMTAEFKKLMKRTEEHFKDTMLADFSKLTESEKGLAGEMEAMVNSIKKLFPEKSTFYHDLALAHLPAYKVTQEMKPDGRIPLLATYREIYDPNTSDNYQVMLVGAYLNFYLEYRITVGGMDMGPDIVDPERLVFTFPDKLLEGVTKPVWVEVKASPKKQTGSGKSAKTEDHVEQHVYVLAMPWNKK